MAIVILFFSACEKESEKASDTEKDYRDKWVGEYTCGIDAFVYKYHINEELHKTENIYISYSLSGYAKVEKKSLDKITVYSHTNFNHDSDTSICKSYFAEPTGPQFDTLSFRVTSDGELFRLNSSDKMGYLHGDSLVFYRGWGGHGGGFSENFKCKKL